MKLEAIDSVCSDLVACHLLALLQVENLDLAFAATCTHRGPHMATDGLHQQQGYYLLGASSEAIML